MAVYDRDRVWYRKNMLVVFWICAALIAYGYAGYPAAVFVISRFVQNSISKKDFLPSVTMIIAAYNESSVIKKKIENTLAIDYPRSSLEIIVFSDGSTDDTDEIVKSFADQGVKLLRVEGRVGKTQCQNDAVALAKNEIVLFSDANSLYDVQAVRNLMRNFSDEKIGVVVGELRYAKNGASDESKYWGIEQFLKKNESAIGSCLGANGTMYAMRRKKYVPLSHDAISDFIEPFLVHAQGLRVVYEPEAFCVEHALANKTEFHRKRRIVARTLHSLKFIKPFLNPLQEGWYSVALWSHKILRWFLFIPMIFIFVASAFLLDHPFFLAIFVVQIIFYSCAFVGYFSRKKIFSIPYLFVIMNAAAIFGAWDAISGKKNITWKTIRYM